MDNICYIYEQLGYKVEEIAEIIESHIEVLPGQNVFVKPNWVINPWKGEEEDWISTVTHPTMIEAVLMILKKKMQGKGCVIVGDAPMTRTKVDIVWDRLKIDEIIEKYNSNEFKVQKLDLRKYYWHYVANTCVSRKRLPGDPKGYFNINLADKSMFADKEKKDYMVTDTEHPISEFHNNNDNMYVISRSILESDVFINLPKLKTHRLAGMTCGMKNLVGTIGIKNCVPHSTYGSNMQKGDCFPEGDADAMDGHSGIRGIVDKIERRKNPLINYCMVPAKIVYNAFFRSKTQNKKAYGAWYGNDTVWRSVVDLNRILLYSDKDGKMGEVRTRKYICIADAIIAGEGEGPLHPSPKECNLLLVSSNPLTLDATACKMMGFNYKKIPFLNESFKIEKGWPLAVFDYKDIQVKSNRAKWDDMPLEKLFEEETLDFRPSHGWSNYIERESSEEK